MCIRDRQKGIHGRFCHLPCRKAGGVGADILCPVLLLLQGEGKAVSYTHLQRVAARTYIFLPIYCEVAVVYLLFCTVITKLQAVLEHRLNARGFQ